MRDSRSGDFFALIMVALSAAIHDEIDLLELLPEPKRSPKAAPAEVAAA